MTEDQIKTKWCSQSYLLLNNGANSKIYGVANRDTNADGTSNISNHLCLGSACAHMLTAIVFDPASKLQVPTVYCGMMPQRPTMP